ncbi:MAG: hypothetical protein EXX96DRAFT_544189 [Benjaminiella poitrasii]|nr:MAG: hypothetical protein EXX96DRAFT_544189 [Benjaminiella poitrasii]
MKRFTYDSSPSRKHLPVALEVNEAPVYFIGPATRDNPMSHIRTKLMGKVVFQDRKIKWNRVTLQFLGKAGIDIDAPRSIFPRDNYLNDLDESNNTNTTTKIQTTVPICEVEKELIFSGEEYIEFGLHLPSHLPASCKTKHSFVKYTLIANFSAGTFFKKYRTQKVVVVKRHYLPSPSAMIPTMDFSGIREWFEWSAEIPKATAIESGEVVIAFRCSVEKERVEVDRIQLSIEEVETYRFCTKQCVHSLPPIITQFPPAIYHLPSFSNNSETHFIRTPIPSVRRPNMKPIHTHQFDPFLEISHRLQLTVYFNKVQNVNIDPLVLEFPIIITDYPAAVSDATVLSAASPNVINTETISHSYAVVGGGDDAVNVDLDLPEYTPRYEETT